MRTGTRNAREKGCTKAENILAMSAEDLQALRRRWRGMADDPNSAGEEDRRFQVMIGVVLSSRAQSTVVSSLGCGITPHASLVFSPPSLWLRARPSPQRPVCPVAVLTMITEVWRVLYCSIRTVTSYTVWVPV